MKILIVDDNATNLKLLRVMLASQGHSVMEAANGADALNILKREKIDAVVSDILMPEMDGYRLCYEIRKSKKLKHVPFIAYTATYTSPSDEKVAREFGVDKFIRKPASLDVILDGIHEVMQEAKHRAPRKLQPPEELAVMKEYSEVLVRKLEEKNAELEAANRKLLEWGERIQALHEIDMAIISTLELDHVLEALLEKLDLFLPYHAITTIRLFNKETGDLELASCRNIDKELWSKIRPRADRGLAQEMFQNPKPMVIRNVQTDPRSMLLNKEFLREQGLASYLEVPLAAKGKTLGILSLYTKEEREFSPDEVGFFITLAGQAAIAIHNAQLLQQSKEQTIELQISNRVKDEFMAVMSHELRTPLTVILGYGELMQEGMLGDLRPKQAGALQKMMSRSKDLLVLINSILEATRLEAEGVRLEISPVALKELLDELKSQYADLRDKDLNLTWDQVAELPQIKTDGPKLKQILENLINNAIKFTDRGSVTVTVEVRGQGLAEPGHLTPDTRRVEFKVTDTGIGIPKEALPFIFERFRQVDSSDTRAHGGVGMGLFIARRFAELLGGKINVESEPGKGSTFKVTIPIENSSQQSGKRWPERTNG